MLRTDIGQATTLRTVPSERVRQILRDLRISADSTFDATTLGKLAEFSNADTVLWGQYLKFGNEIRIDATLVDVKRQKVDPLKAAAPNQSGLLAAVDELAQAIRGGLFASADVLAELKETAFKPSTNVAGGAERLQRGAPARAARASSPTPRRSSRPRSGRPGIRARVCEAGPGLREPGIRRRGRAAVPAAPSNSPSSFRRRRRTRIARHARIVNDTQGDRGLREPRQGVAGGFRGQLRARASSTRRRAIRQGAGRYKKVLRGIRSPWPRCSPGPCGDQGGELPGGDRPLNRALRSRSSSRTTSQRADILHAIGAGLQADGKPDDALTHYQRVSRDQAPLGQKRGIAVTRRDRSRPERLGQIDAALASLKEALQLQREIGDKEGDRHDADQPRALLRGRGNYGSGVAVLQRSRCSSAGRSAT